MKIIGRAGTGIDNIDVASATEKGILVMNTPGGNTRAAAELAITLLMAVARQLPQAVASVKQGRWDRKLYMGSEVAGKTIGVVGLGRIGREVAEWCQGAGMEVVGFDPVLSKEAAAKEGIELLSLDELLQRSDFISLHCPLTADTKHLIGRKTLAQCKKGVRIVNCARGGVVDEAALLEAIEAGHVGGAALDVFETEPPTAAGAELVKHPAVVATPHLGASTHEAQLTVAKAIATQIADAFDHGRYVGVVNASFMDQLKRPDLVPYLSIAERLGQLQAQLLPGAQQVKQLRVRLQGPAVSDPTVAQAIKTAVTKGFLSALSANYDVNMINAGQVAKRAGLSVQELIDERSGMYQNLITVEVDSSDAQKQRGASLSGAVLSGDQTRLVEVDGFKVDMDPAGHMLFFENKDKPGVLRDLTAVLGEAGINIAYFGLGRHVVGGDALGVVQVDQSVSTEVLERLAGVQNLEQIRPVRVTDERSASRLRASSPYDSESGAAFRVPLTVRSDSARKPAVRPVSPQFSSGPTKKRPGWSLGALVDAATGRSHRSKLGKAKLREAIDVTRRLLDVPDDYRVGVVPASDTGAYEMAMWTMLGARPVDVFHWESFGKGWMGDAKSHLGLEATGLREFSAPYGELPDLSQADWSHDVCFTWNGTTSGVKVPNADWIPDDREGLAFCDATSAVFAQHVPVHKTDVLTYSWQKVLGGEGAHGMLILSPRAVERLETFTPENRPMPKIFRLTKKGKIMEDVFKGSTINTPSMLCVEDYLDALRWADEMGGVDGLVRRADDNLSVMQRFVDETPWASFLAKDPATLSNTSVCLSVDLPGDKIKEMVSLLDTEGVAFDIGAYRDAPPGLRIWCGATVEKTDLEALVPWLRWAYNVVASAPAEKP